MRTTLRRSVSLDLDLAEWVNSQAAAENRSVSSFVNAILKQARAEQIPVSKEVAVEKVKEEAP